MTHYALSHAQKRIWYVENMIPASSLHNIGGVVLAEGASDLDLLERSIQQLIRLHDGIRHQLTIIDGEPRQKMAPFTGERLQTVDFSAMHNQELACQKWVDERCGRPFQLLDSPLYEFVLLRLGPARIGYFIKLHHLIADGWSIKIMTEEIDRIGRTIAANEEVTDQTGSSYLTHLEQEEQYLSSDRFLKNKSFWADRLSDLPPELFLKSSDDLQAERMTFTMPPDEAGRLRTFAKEHKCSLNTLFIALMRLYLYKSTGKMDAILGTPVLNRTGKKEKGTFGMYTSTMPFRLKLDPLQTVESFVRRVNEELMSCFFHQKYPYNLLVQDLELRKRGIDQLYQVVVNYSNAQLSQQFCGHPVQNMEFFQGKQTYSLHLLVKDWDENGHLRIDIEYKTNDYTAAQIRRMYGHFLTILGQMTERPSMPIRELEFLTCSEKQFALSGFNATSSGYPRDCTIHRLFERQAAAAPDRIAIVDGHRSLTYREVAEKVRRFALLLSGQGVTKGSLLGLMAAHSPETVIGILAVLKAGGAYVPIDPAYPPERIEHILEDSGASVLLVGNDAPNRPGTFNGLVIPLAGEDAGGMEADSASGVAPSTQHEDDPDQLAYVIYTSGSTGKPKGVMVRHRNLVNYIYWARQMYVKHEDEAFALYSSLAFDLTVTSVFTPLIGGNSLRIYEDRGADFVLDRIMRDNKASIVKLTPAHLSLLKTKTYPDSSVRRFIVGGEDLKASLAKAIHECFCGGIEIYNEYGPTEATVGCMIYRFDPARDTEGSVPIGVPAHNSQIYVLNADMQPLSYGMTGELYISGDGVAAGYRNRPELTADKFIADPFRPGQVMYKTGDLAMLLDSGQLMYLGRTDHQVKLKGYRIELGEIESKLSGLPLVQDAVVADRRTASGEPYLCAYVVAEAGFEERDCRRQLERLLPQYMIPARFVRLAELPLTSNGKVNREALPEPGDVFVPEAEGAGPSTPLETTLARIYGEVLGVERFGSGDNFYYAGGDSIKAIQIVTKISELGLNIRVRDILSYPVIRELVAAAHISEARIADPSPRSGTVKLLPMMRRFFEWNFPNPNHWNQSVLLSMHTALERQELGSIIHALLAHHDSLRFNVRMEAGVQAVYYNEAYLADSALPDVPEYDLSGCSEEERLRMLELYGRQVKASVRLEDGCLFRAALFSMGDGEQRVLLTAHHLAVDGVSWRILLGDFHTLLHKRKENKPLELPHKTHSVEEWAEAAERYLEAHGEEELAYWQTVVAEARSEQSRSGQAVGEAERLEAYGQTVDCTVELDEAQTHRLLKEANGYQAGPQELLLAALALTLQGQSRLSRTTIELEGHGREDFDPAIGVNRTVGWFTAMYPFMIPTADPQELHVLIPAIKAALADIPSGGVGYGLLQQAGKLPLADARRGVRFNYLGEMDNGLPQRYFSLCMDSSGPDIDEANPLTAAAEWNVMVVSNRLRAMLKGHPAFFTASMAADFADRYREHIVQVLDHCGDDGPMRRDSRDFSAAELSDEDLNVLFG